MFQKYFRKLFPDASAIVVIMIFREQPKHYAEMKKELPVFWERVQIPVIIMEKKL